MITLTTLLIAALIVVFGVKVALDMITLRTDRRLAREVLAKVQADRALTQDVLERVQDDRALTRTVLARDQELAVVVRRVDAVLRVWAEHWGEPADQVRPRLLDVFREAGQ